MALLLLSAGLSIARAEDRTYGPFKVADAHPDVISLDGQIVIGSGLDFRRALIAAPKAKTLVLNSPGGLVAIALLIADDVYQRHIDTLVPADSGCFSACALIFFAGASRTAEGKLGVHQISSDTPDLGTAQLTISDIIDMLNKFGTPTDVLTTMFRTPSSDIHVFTADEISRYGINRSTTAQVQAAVQPSPEPVPTVPDEHQLPAQDPVGKLLHDLPPAPLTSSPPPASKLTPDQLAKLVNTPPAAGTPRPARDRQTVCGDFVTEYFSDWSQENDVALPRMGSDYAPEINFFGKLTARTAVLDEKRKFAARWPTRSYTVRAGTVNVTMSGGACTVTGVVDWSASSEVLHKSPHGSATFVIELDAAPLPLITGESSTPLRSPASNDIASAAVSQSADLPTGHVTLVSGQCEPTSHTAEGPIGSDLTKRQSRFFCDSAVVNFFSNYKGHVMVQFAQKVSHHDPILGFAGSLDEAGVMMKVDHLYLESGQAITINDGFCKFFFKGRSLSGMACGAMVDETGRRTTAIVAFDADPGQ